MATVVLMRPRRSSPEPVREVAARRWWLTLTVPIGVLGIIGSLAGIFVDRIYREETPDWAAQAVGQDAANLVVLGVMLVLGYAAQTGSARAYLAWLGTVTYTVYAYAIYVFAVHFGPLFLLYVLVFGMSVWALIGGLANLEPRHVRAAFTQTPGAGFVSVFLVVVGVGFALLWLSEDVAATITGDQPEALAKVGLCTNPVHVLDLGLFLPTAIIAGVLLHRRHPWGHVMAPVVLAAMAGISAGIVAVTIVASARGLESSPVVAVVIGVLGAVQAIACWRLLRGLDPTVSTEQILRHQARRP